MSKESSEDPKLPAKAPQLAFSYNGVDFTFDDRRFINLTAMWKAAGSETSKDPRQWRRKEGSGFIADLAKNLNVPLGHIIVGERGKGGATWAHWQISVAYAKYLSHEFHRFVNEAFREWAEEKADPGLKIERGIDAYLKHGKEVEWIERRFKGITARKALCSTMADHNCKIRGNDNPYAEITRAISLKILGKTPSEIREEKGLAKSAATRDALDESELLSIEWAEVQARKLIKTEAADGNVECVDAGRRAASAIKTAIDSLAKKTA